MYDIAPWLGKANTSLTFAIVIVGFITVSCLLGLLRQRRAFRAGARDVALVSPTGVLNDTATDVLDARNLLSELNTVTNWCLLGIYLRLLPHELTRIEQDYRGSERQMMQMLNLWLQRTPKASWEDVVSALQEMREKRVAENIRRKYIKRESKL